MANYEEYFENMEEEWNFSQGQYDQQFGGEEIDDGTYQTRLQSAKVRLSKTSGNLMISREHLITEGEFQGRVVYDQLMMTTSRNLVYVRHWIEMMGYAAPESMKEIPSIVEAIQKDMADVEIRLTTDGEYKNVEIIKLIGVNEQDSSTEVIQEDTETSESSGEYTLEDLISTCGEIGVDLTGINLEDPEKVMDQVRSYAIPEDNLTSDQIEMFKAVGLEDCIAFNEEPTEKVEEDPRKEKIIAFLIGQGIDYDDSDSVDVLIERIGTKTFFSDKLTDEEFDLLSDLDLRDLIKEPVVQKKTLPLNKPLKTPAKKLPVGKKLPPRKK